MRFSSKHHPKVVDFHAYICQHLPSNAKTHHVAPHVSWKTINTSPRELQNHTYGFLPTQHNRSPWSMPRALAGSSVEHNFGGAKMSTGEMFLALTIFMLTAFLVALIAEDDDDTGGMA